MRKIVSNEIQQNGNVTRAVILHRQSGLAMLIVLFALALMTILVAGMMSRQSLFIYKSSFLFNQAQANEYALAAESFARQVLRQDYNIDKKNKKMVDGRNDIWNKYAVAFPVNYGLVDLQVDDLQGRINLNDIVNTKGALNPVQAHRLQNLLDILNIKTITVDKIKDWIDADVDPTGSTGAEDGTYLGLYPAYRAANQPFVSVSELRLLFEVSNDDYQKILPFVAALPQGTTGININTASKEVLRSLGKTPLSDAEVQTLFDRIKKTPYTTIADFLAAPELAGTGINKKNNDLSVNSEYFLMSARVSFASNTARLRSIIYRSSKDGKMSILFRDQGQKYLINKQHVKVGS